MQQGKLSAAVSQDGTLTYRARPDGSPFAAINHARGTYTELPEAGDKVGCGDVLYRVDDEPGAAAVRHGPGLPRAARGRRAGATSVSSTATCTCAAPAPSPRGPASALEALQRRRGAHATGALALGDAVFLPEAVRIAKVTGQLGGPARPGAPVLSATSDTLARAGEPRSVRAGPGQAGRPRADHAAGQHDGDGQGRRVRTRRRRPRPDRAAAPPTRRSPPTSASTTRARRAGSTRPRSGCDITTTGVDERAERPGHRAGRQVRRRVRGRGRARRRAARAGRRDAWACSTPPAGASRSRATCARATASWCRRCERRGPGARRR